MQRQSQTHESIPLGDFARKSKQIKKQHSIKTLVQTYVLFILEEQRVFLLFYELHNFCLVNVFYVDGNLDEELNCIFVYFIKIIVFLISKTNN